MIFYFPLSSKVSWFSHYPSVNWRWAHALPGQLWGLCTPCHSRGMWVLANFVLPGGQAFANPRATPELLAHTCIPIQTYKLLNMEDFTGNTSRFKDWLICQGQEKLEYRGFLRYVSSILCPHFFITYQVGS